MATKKTAKDQSAANGAEQATAGTDTSTTGTAPTKNRGGRNPDSPVFSWSDDRSEVLVLLLFQNPGQLTAQQLVTTLSQHPAFVSDAAALNAEKVRQQVNRLNARAEELGYPALTLRRSKSTTSGTASVLAKVFGQMGIQPQPVVKAPETPAAAPIVTAPIVTASAAQPAAQTAPHYLHQGSGQALPGFAGGLIPTPGSAG